MWSSFCSNVYFKICIKFVDLYFIYNVSIIQQMSDGLSLFDFKQILVDSGTIVHWTLAIILKVLRLNFKLTSVCFFEAAVSLFLTIPEKLCKTWQCIWPCQPYSKYWDAELEDGPTSFPWGCSFPHPCISPARSLLFPTRFLFHFFLFWIHSQFQYACQGYCNEKVDYHQ